MDNLIGILKTHKKSLLLILACLLVLFISPYITIGKSAPFESLLTRLILIALICKKPLSNVFKWIASSSFFKKPQQSIKQFNWQSTKERFKIFSKNVYNIFIKICRSAVAKTHSQSEDKTFKKLPMYLIIGKPGSGKKSLIERCGIQFLPGKHISPQATQLETQFSDYDFLFSKKGIIVNTRSQDQGLINNKGFIKYLRKNRGKHPISGLILSIELSSLLTQKSNDIYQQINEITSIITYYHEHLNINIPVYLMLNQCDHIEGFVEYFNDLSQEELSQIWGITFPIITSKNIHKINLYFNEVYNTMMANLNKRVLRSIDSEKNLDNRRKIYAFPQQMQLFKQPIMAFIQELFSTNQGNPGILLRGIYMTSSTQGTQKINFLAQALSTNISYNHSSPTLLLRQEGYFISQLFNHVIIPEGHVLGFNKQSQYTKRLIYKLMCVLVPVVTVAGFLIFSHAYKQNIHTATTLRANLAQFEKDKNQLQDTDTNITHTLPMLNSIYSSYQLLSDNPWYTSLLYSSHALKSKTHDALHRAIHVYFLPRVARQLEEELTHAQNNNPNTLYALLKGYLAFSPSGNVQSNTIIAPMDYYWDNNENKNEHTIKSLKYYLQLGSNDRLDMLPLDRPLIKRVRSQLQKIIPSDRAYGLLTFKAATSDIPNLNLAHAIGSTYHQIFVNTKHMNEINSLYTLSGYQNIYQSQTTSIAKQVANDNQEIGLDTNNTQDSQKIKVDINKTYEDTYQDTWKQLIGQINIKSINNLQELDALFKTISSNNSPLKKLIEIIVTNTEHVPSTKNQYAGLSAFNDNFLSPSYRNINKSFNRLHKYINSINSDQHPNKAAYLAAVDFFQNNKDNPLREFDNEIAQTPQPVNKWLKSISQNTWKIINQQALNYINQQWNKSVIPAFQATINGRFPYDHASKTDINMNDFTEFFSPSGKINQFYQQYLNHFINSETDKWVPIKMGDHHFNLRQSSINVFSQSKLISDDYFNQKTNKPTIRFTIYPRTLSKNVKLIVMHSGSNSLNYQHGPITPQQFSWPLPENTEISKLSITAFNGQISSLTFYGPWSWYRLINENQIHMTQTGKSILLSASINGQNSTFRINTTALIDTLQLKPFHLLHIKNKLEEENNA